MGWLGMGQTIREAFAQWLREQLRSQGWMVSDFARSVGVRPSAVYRWTAGQRTPTDAQIDTIAQVLDVSPNVLWNELARDGIQPIGAPTKAKEPRVIPPRVPAPPPEERPFACWLRQQMAEHGWTTGSLARLLDLDIVTVRAWSQGLRTPASVQHARLAKVIGVDVETIRCLADR